jgi:hypothetical protein
MVSGLSSHGNRLLCGENKKSPVTLRKEHDRAGRSIIYVKHKTTALCGGFVKKRRKVETS